MMRDRCSDFLLGVCANEASWLTGQVTQKALAHSSNVSILTYRPASMLTPQVPDWKQEGEPDAPDEMDLTAEDLIVTGQLLDNLPVCTHHSETAVKPSLCMLRQHGSCKTLLRAKQHRPQAVQ